MSADLRAAVEELTREVKALKKAQQRPDRKAYKASEVAAMLGCETQTVREMIHDGRLEAVDMGTWYLIPVAAVDAMLAQTVGAA
jgi:excisionase family DNA binding protein